MKKLRSQKLENLNFSIEIKIRNKNIKYQQSQDILEYTDNFENNPSISIDNNSKISYNHSEFDLFCHNDFNYYLLTTNKKCSNSNKFFLDSKKIKKLKKIKKFWNKEAKSIFNIFNIRKVKNYLN